ncbi:hypothetical protein Q1695_015518 [Nippostrongylus brasiliensis]|nr:hypothetical protein Q1695_015518 [Nippostrongylus brasiliensis]
MSVGAVARSVRHSNHDMQRVRPTTRQLGYRRPQRHMATMLLTHNRALDVALQIAHAVGPNTPQATGEICSRRWRAAPFTQREL